MAIFLQHKNLTNIKQTLFYGTNCVSNTSHSVCILENLNAEQTKNVKLNAQFPRHREMNLFSTPTYLLNSMTVFKSKDVRIQKNLRIGSAILCITEKTTRRQNINRKK